ncbi:hypothetical protein [Stenotrophomonas sp. 169]|uniref:hypothetical protein n=1 Tax=Stenotrophomonas sp. 169 TaxID=2770322 RepID=UPI001CB79178|nr:hypothetical protein [Stenotrophomonas sp. 169]
MSVVKQSEVECEKMNKDIYSDERLGFVIACLLSQAITIDEFNDWAGRALLLEGAPNFLVDLADFHEAPFKVYRVIGYVPDWTLERSVEHAIIGIAVSRGIIPFEMPISRDEALESIRSNKLVCDMFSMEFPLIRI